VVEAITTAPVLVEALGGFYHATSPTEFCSIVAQPARGRLLLSILLDRDYFDVADLIVACVATSRSARRRIWMLY
jgi:hypothetical protein